MRVDEFDFELPEDLIALRPARPRTSARLLVVRGPAGEIEDRSIGDLPALLSGGDILVRNSTRVIKALLSAIRAPRQQDGVPVPVGVNLNRRMDDASWSVFLRPGKRVAVGDALKFGDDLAASVTSKLDGGEFHISFDHSGDDLDRAIEKTGRTPLPPYILSKRETDALDENDYQTCFAETGNSVAAPTAGLHFTPELLADIALSGVNMATVSLDVNAGTFLPMKGDTLAEHRMHAEHAHLTIEEAARINAARAQGGRCIAVGTTALRTLESAVGERGVDAYDADTSIFITPGYQFKVVDGLLTNFHLPRSTLFVLVCALMGVDVMKRAYRHAIEQRYRFYSYGDACLLLPHG